MIETDRIYLMDCMEGMKQIADSSVDAIIADLPYGVLNRSKPRVAERSGDGTSQCQTYAAPAARGYSGIL